MVDFISYIKEYFLQIYVETYPLIIYLYTVMFICLFILILDCLGFVGRARRGSNAAIRFYKKNGWVDYSNLNLFMKKCIRKFPFVIRTKFKLFVNSDLKFTDLVDIDPYNIRDFSAREKVLKYSLDSVFALITAIILVYSTYAMSLFDLVKILVIIVLACFIRIFLVLCISARHLYARNVYIKAVSLINNAVFLGDNKIKNIESKETIPLYGVKVENIDEGVCADIDDLDLSVPVQNITH